MSCNQRLLELLQQSKMQHDVMPHREVFTSQEVAQSTHVPGRLLAKVVVLRQAREVYLMAVIPATLHVDLSLFHRMTGRQGVALATEEELRRLFPDCEPGAMPPFGKLYGMPMYLDGCFSREKDIYFQAGNHHEVVRMRFEDYQKLARPFAGDFCLHHQVTSAHL